MSEPEKDEKPGPAGRVRHDAGGRAVWEWAIESGRHAIDSTSRLLKKLDVGSLRLMGDDEKIWDKKPGAKAPAEATLEMPGAQQFQLQQDTPAAEVFGGPREVDTTPAKRQSFNPYDSRTPARSAAPRSTRPSVKPAAARAPAKLNPPPPQPGLLSRLFGRK